MKERWLQLELREQRLVLVMAAVVLFFILYSAIWAPLNDGIEAASKKIERQQKLLTWVQEGTAKYKSAAGLNRSNNSSSLSGLVNRTAGRNQISIARMQPQGDDLQVWIDEVSFNNLLTWLEQLSEKEGISVKAIDITNAQQAGVVKVRRLQLGRS